MDDGDTQRPDATSIKPVSSLRSKFENLGQDKSTERERKPSLRSRVDKGSSDEQTRVAHGSQNGGRGEAPPVQYASKPGNITGTPAAAIPRMRRLTPPSQRPQSMVQFSPRQRSPPRVTVDSPNSPPKLHALDTTPRPSPGSGTHNRTLSHTPSPTGLGLRYEQVRSQPYVPALHQRASLDLRSATKGFHERLAGTESPATTSSSSVPPPVNRAGKPKVTPMANKTQEPASAPRGPSLDTSRTPNLLPTSPDENRLSPFSTPPSSAEGTPDETAASPPDVDQRLKPRIGRTETMPESYFRPPPTHHAVRERKVKQARRGVQDSPTLAMRHARPQDGVDEEEAPNLPPRRTTQSGSGRTSPVRIAARRSVDTLRRPSNTIAVSNLDTVPPKRIPQTNTALTHAGSGTSSPARRRSPPALPAPRRSIETRRDISPIMPSREDFVETPSRSSSIADRGSPIVTSEFPDPSKSNRRPPKFRSRPWEISTGYDTRLCAACGEYVCTTGYVTRVWSIVTGEVLLTLPHDEGVRVTAVAWKPAKDVADEGKRLWLGTNIGDMLELDVPSKSVIQTRQNAHPRREIQKMYRYAAQLWSLDEEGRLNVWRAGVDGLPSLNVESNSFRVPRGHTCSIAVGDQLWIATGKEIRVFKPGATSDSDFNLLQRPISQETAGEVTSGATITTRPNEVYFGHADGKVSVYDRRSFALLGLFSVNTYRISAMAGVGDCLWAGFSTGMTYVYDTSTNPWTLKKDWRAHANSVASIVVDQSSVWKMDRLQVVTLGTDNMLRIWDGMLHTDWIDAAMRQQDEVYCTFNEITASVMTWNAGASKPNYLRNNEKDSSFFRDYLSSYNPPDIFVFGFQELVDLEDKKATAIGFFKSKRKDPSEQEHMSHQYRAWRDHLVRSLVEVMPVETPYTLVHTTSMVGLFSCIFVKSSMRPRITAVNTAEVKRGMGGHHGNKGALIIRFTFDDSSMCFVNCHLAAGQTQTINRNNDIAAILESEILPPAADSTDLFVGGGDGAMILDHEICILNGDLNYRIDAMTRDAVVKAVRDRNYNKLLDRDQLLLSRKKNPGFRLRLFQELPITFAPTYKYNVGTDDYDSSEKKRSPAWCDRILFRGLGRVKCEEYRRWEVRVSDHRPVTARFKLRVKSVDQHRRSKVLDKAEAEYERFRQGIAHQVKLDYLTNVLGLQKQAALQLLR